LMAQIETVFHHCCSTQDRLLNFGEFFHSSGFLSNPTVDHRSPGWTRDSLFPPLGEFTWCFLETPKKNPDAHTCRLSVNSENALPSHTPVLPGRATMGIVHHLSVLVWAPWESSWFWTLGSTKIVPLGPSQIQTLNFQSTK
jgi:hypothetical protein